jgi:hypothetical protein
MFTIRFKFIIIYNFFIKISFIKKLRKKNNIKIEQN